MDYTPEFEREYATVFDERGEIETRDCRCGFGAHEHRAVRIMEYNSEELPPEGGWWSPETLLVCPMSVYRPKIESLHK